MQKMLVGLVFGLLIFGLFFGVHGVRAENAAAKDSDYDGLTDSVETSIYHTNPLNADTDGDGYLDSAEVLVGTNPLQPNTTAQDVVQKTKTISYPWYISRASAITGFIFMFLIVVLGTGMTMGYAYKMFNPVFAWVLHKYLSIAFLVSVLVHGFSLMFDTFIKFGFTDVLIPFMSSFKPLYVGFGVIGLYLLLIIALTSIFMRTRAPKFWRSVHYLVYPLFVFGCVHGFLTGTDSKTLWMQVLYGMTSVVFVWLVFYRFIMPILRRA